jgi:sugar lactone lactonase YvrE
MEVAMPNNALVPEPQVLMDGLAFGESPRWHDDRLWFSDWGAQEVIAVDLQGKSEVITRVESFPFCIDFLPDGRLIVVSAADRMLLRLERDASLAEHADLSELSEYKWNDIALDSRGNIFVNNVGFDFPGGEFAPGLLAVVAPDGSARQVADGIAFPNGMVVTPDDSTLIVAESYGSRLTAFDIAADGGLSNRRVWAELDHGAPDGICLDAEGAVWYGDVPNKCCVRVREGGEVLQTFELDRGCFACALGGTTGSTLFMVATKWGGTSRMGEGERTGQVLMVEVDRPSAGRTLPTP